MSRDRASGLKVRVRRRNLDSEYTIVPNALFKGVGIYRGLHPFERVLLGAGLSCEDGWETTLEDIESWLPDIGRDRQERFRRNLRERGFLSMTRTQIPAGETDAGKYMWTLSFSMEPLPVEERDELQEKKPRAAKPKPSADALVFRASEEIGDGDETAGRPMPGSPGHRRAGHRRAGPGYQGDVYKEEKNQYLKEEPPPTPQDEAAATAPDDAVTGGEDPHLEEQDKLLLREARERAVELRAAVGAPWKAAAVQAAMEAALKAGRSVGDIAAAIVLAAQDRTSIVPTRILNEVWWSQTFAASTTFVPSPPRPAGERCDKPGHEGTLKASCGFCRGERIAANQPETVAENVRAKGQRRYSRSSERAST